MQVLARLKPSEYHDSVTLMLAAQALTGLEGVRDAAVVMATESNKSILASAGLLAEVLRLATPNDLAIVVSGEDLALLEKALQKAETLLKRQTTAEEPGEFAPRSIRGAISLDPDANVAVISVAGQYAADEAWEALHRGLHVLLFSDHVFLDDEIALKEYARAHGLLLMGPGAGTAILNHVALGFANVVPSGPIGIVSAAGTGLQEVSCLLARHGMGISQAIGVGGRDPGKAVGGVMTLEALKALQQDPATEVITLISKPASPDVARRIVEHVSVSDKPTVLCMLGQEPTSTTPAPNVIPARTLEESALLAIRANRHESLDLKAFLTAENVRFEAKARQLRPGRAPAQRYLRGLFSGGTLCYEAQVVWRAISGLSVLSNAPLPGASALADPLRSQGHTAVDMGEEQFTSGRPHPMIDNSLRVRRILQEAGDPAVAVIMLDVVLGYGAHPDPASELAGAVDEGRRLAQRGGRDLVVVASVTGTDDDPQGFSASVSTLERAGVIVCGSNAAAARLTGLLVTD